MTTEEREALQKELQGTLLDVKAKLIRCQELASDLEVTFEISPNLWFEGDDGAWVAAKTNRLNGKREVVVWSQSSWCMEHE